jgi:hypothetical protein
MKREEGVEILDAAVQGFETPSAPDSDDILLPSFSAACR